MYDLINNINSTYNSNTEAELIELLLTQLGQENFRPNLNEVKSLLLPIINALEESSRIIVIGGTNGKGETAHCLRQLLAETDDVMLWTSPHVLSIRERFVLNNEVISYDKLSEIVRLVFKNLESKNLSLSFYEFCFSCFITWANEVRPKYLILEVGLGGRYDAVNLFSNPLTAITSISRDHTKILGNSLSEILFEKYGVTRENGRLFCGVEQVYLRDLIKNWTTRDNINLSFVEGIDYRARNREMALRLFEELTHRYTESKTIEWQVTKGRFEIIRTAERDFVFVGAHNIDGHRKLLELLNFSRQNNCNIIDNKTVMLLSFSTGREDQVEDILSLYQSYPCLFKSVFVTSFDGDRSMERETIEKLNSLFDFESNWNNFFDDKYKNTTIYISGSYYFIAAFQLYILSK